MSTTFECEFDLGANIFTQSKFIEWFSANSIFQMS